MSTLLRQLYAEVALSTGMDRLLSYAVPSELELEPGHRVRVPLGRTEAHGYVVGLSSDRPNFPRIREVLAVEPAERLVPDELLELTHWVSQYYLAPWGQVMESALPANIRKGGFRDRRFKAAANETGGETDTDIETETDGKTDADKNVESDRGDETSERSLRLTADQSAALQSIQSALQTGSYRPFLLYGVTGSGKTEVYLRAAAEVLERGGQVLFLIPEIAMGAQILARVQARFPEQVGLYHSQAGAAERRRVWVGAGNGTLPIVVGARSAVFVPMPNLQLVVVDEEHEAAYKQEDSPRYHGRDVAIYRARASSAVVVLGSATPSLESWDNAKQGKYERIELPDRIDSRPKAEVEVVDLSADDEDDATSSHSSQVFSPRLISLMGERLQRGEQTILFLNRRGHSTVVQCGDCGETISCESCDVVMTFHRSDQRLRCHYCNSHRREPDRCAECGGGHFFYGGFGTQRIEEELQDLLPRARVARMDRDAMKSRGSHGRLVEEMEVGDVDILLGTQMVAKGFDFPRVTLVGVLFADQEFLLPDFRAGERGFQILTQVAGRAGRGDRAGRVVFQTLMPEHYVIRAAAEQHYETFAEQETDYRRDLGYPPFGRIIHLLIDGAKEAHVENRAEHIAERISARIAEGRVPARSIGPAPMPISRLKGQYRWHLGLISQSVRALHDLARFALEDKPPRGLSGTRIVADVDPVSML